MNLDKELQECLKKIGGSCREIMTLQAEIRDILEDRKIKDNFRTEVSVAR